MISGFSGKYRWLSNFFVHAFQYDGRLWDTVEHAFQASKAKHPDDYTAISEATTPGRAKRLGRKVELRDDWEDVKVGILTDIVTAKFEQNEALRSMLLSTMDAELVEGNNWHDNFWGNCTCDKCKDIEGENWLGNVLMSIRHILHKRDR